MDSNSLGNIIKDSTARAWVYGVWVIAGIIIGAMQAGFTDPDPQWLETTFSVWSYIGLFVGSLAAVNSNIVPKFVAVDKANTINTQNINVAPPE